MRIPRLVVAGVSSGVGKTSVTCAIIRALRGRFADSVVPFKTGPDYIDPRYLGAAAGGDAYNLDEWLMGKKRMLESFARHSNSAGISVIEGVMGYYDGHSLDSDVASTYGVASATESPVLLVVDASKAARSVAATALGFVRFRRNSRIAGVILNRLGSDRHASICAEALRLEGIQTVGCIRRDASLRLAERHLGLLSTLDEGEMQQHLCAIAEKMTGYLDVERIRAIAHSAGPVPSPRPAGRAPQPPGPSAQRATIAVALDSSFNFYYADNLEALRRQGARLIFFSPVSDDALPACDGLYIGGGFPEVLAAKLGRNASMRQSVRRLVQDGAPTYAECGGLMYLSKYIEDADGRRHRMTGVLDASVSMTDRPVLGYTRGSIRAGTPVTGRGGSLRGHEFHYSQMTDVPADAQFAVTLQEGRGITGGMDGILQHGALASYGHLYFDASDCAARFVSACARYGRR